MEAGVREFFGKLATRTQSICDGDGACRQAEQHDSPSDRLQYFTEPDQIQYCCYYNIYMISMGFCLY